MFEQTRETNDFRTQWIFELSFPSLVCLHKICFPECWLRFFGERRKNRNLGQRPCAFLGKPQKKTLFCSIILSLKYFLVSSASLFCFYFYSSCRFLFFRLSPKKRSQHSGKQILCKQTSEGNESSKIHCVRKSFVSLVCSNILLLKKKVVFEVVFWSWRPGKCEKETL